MEKKMEFHLGMIGACLPIITIFVGIMGVVIAGYTSSKNFWFAGFMAVIVAFLVAKNKRDFNDIVIKGLTNNVFIVLLIAFFFAGILAKLLDVGGLVQGILWLTSKMELNAVYVPAITFLVCVLISTCTGTTGGTVATVTPIMLPVAVQLGCSPELVMGAIISGSFFGDNLAPVSDTTIASALTQETEVSLVVKSRFKYSIVAGLAALALYILFGHTTTAPMTSELVFDSHAQRSLILLLSPALLIFLMVRGAKLVTALTFCNLITILLCFALGVINMDTLISTKGVIVTGIEGMISTVVFCVFLFSIIEMLKAGGVFTIIIDRALEGSKTPRQAEFRVGILSMVTCALTAASTVAICMIGPVVREILKRFNIDRARGANLLDGLCSGVAGVTFYNLSFMMAYSLAMNTGVLPDNFNIIAITPYSFHCWALIAIYLIAICSGWGRKFETTGETASLAGPVDLQQEAANA